MRIEWVNHASFILAASNITMISDPWLDGTVFDNGWALLSDTKFKYEDFSRITHIWFSHEHPDHFNPPNLKQIPAAYRSKITVIFQETKDKKVVQYCENVLGFNVVELKQDQWYRLSSDMEIMCCPVYGDSWLAVKTNDVSILNLNDCVLTEDEAIRGIKNQVGHIDVLLTQFSFAKWVGNKNDTVSRKKHANEKLDTLRKQVRLLQPEFVIPFASYIWFCHADNYYMNADVNRIEDVYNTVLNDKLAAPVVMYPGDIWHLGKQYNSAESIAKYNVDYQRVLTSPTLVFSQRVDINDLLSDAKRFAHALLTANKKDVVEYLLDEPAAVYLTDYKQALLFSLKTGLTETSIPAAHCDVALSSEALHYCFQFLWGGDTLNINGRFQIPEHGAYVKFRKFFVVSNLNNRAVDFDLPFLQNIITKIKNNFDDID
ncbi:MBL fold metallo-hydrolase [Paenibacillus xerothermodurans]|uniref:MBL fold metallo-hydrolase n=1 Tax=Paenibacillus xerothermodurans TaxID=1977292 RepID=A0A2W1N9P4_PAEXE|nr:MBL fold metallo-hydrolase [Paenibacillus xerothermodurans]PZE21137.1 hypothetical protein CBW46_010700 [Paenibacillus xerothermodurans]